jgi:GNAT superfamily N-acetyltransferase
MSAATCSIGEQGVYALLTDGTTLQIRPARQEDHDAVRDMHAAMSADNLYLRFFTLSKLAPEWEARRICREPGLDHAALLALLDGDVIGCGSFERGDEDSGSAEIALAVADGAHGRGVGTLLLEHMVAIARGRGIRAFTAQTLAENTPMLRVFAKLGLPVHRVLTGDVYDLCAPLPAGGTSAALSALPGRGSLTGAVSRRGQPAACAGPGLGRGHRRQPGPAVGRAGRGDAGPDQGSPAAARARRERPGRSGLRLPRVRRSCPRPRGALRHLAGGPAGAGIRSGANRRLPAPAGMTAIRQYSS